MPPRGVGVKILTFFTASAVKRAVSRARNFTIFDQNEATIPLFIYKTILKHQEKEIHHVLKEEKVMVCSSPFWEQNSENFSNNLKKIRLTFFKFNSLRSNHFMTRDNYQQFLYTGVVIITKLDHYFPVSVNPNTFLGF